MKKGKLMSLLVIISLVLTLLSPAAYGSNGTKGRPAPKGQSGQGGSDRGGSGGSHHDSSAPEILGDEGEGGSGNSSDRKGGVSRGGSDKGKGGGAKKGTTRKDSTHGKITLEVTVLWPEDITDPEEVDVILTRDGIDTVATTNEDGVATFISEAGGDCYLRGEDVPGFLTPGHPVSLIGSMKTVEETLEYIEADIPVEEVTLNESELELISGYPYQLTATVKPLNASNQKIYWESGNESVATVIDGLIEPVSSGTAVITVTTADGMETATCEVTVVSIESLVDPDPVAASKNEVVILPATVKANLDNGDETQLQATWKDETGEDVGFVFQVPLTNPCSSYTFVGSAAGTVDTAELVITVDQAGQPAVPVVGVSLDLNEVSMFVGDSANLTVYIIPDSATTQDVIWTSSNTGVAVVEDGLVTAAAPGSAIIAVETIDGGFKAYCQISVALAPEPALIYPTQESFDSPQEVCVNVKNLVEYKSITEDLVYHVKVEQKGSGQPLGEGIVTIGPDTEVFNVYDATGFVEGDNYSHEYYLSMSTDPKYPLNDELTLKTNFKIGTAVPTISMDNVRVTLDMVGGPLDGNPEGIIFLLCREIDLEDGNPSDDVSQSSWVNYCVNPNVPYDKLEFIDEVKMMGRTNAEGLVEWIEPREPLKLGGYILLEVTPDGYIDNLNLVNPESEDGALLKEVHLTRDGVIERDVVNTYVADGSGPWGI